MSGTDQVETETTNSPCAAALKLPAESADAVDVSWMDALVAVRPTAIMLTFMTAAEAAAALAHLSGTAEGAAP